MSKLELNPRKDATFLTSYFDLNSRYGVRIPSGTYLRKCMRSDWEYNKRWNGVSNIVDAIFICTGKYGYT